MRMTSGSNTTTTSVSRSKMSIGSNGPQNFKDSIVQFRVHRERDQFIADIREDAICRLASSYHNGDHCRFFKPPCRGSYNICYFVHFPSNSSDEDVEKWVVRVPLAPCLAHGSRSKLESEIATMQLVADKTTIPLPKIHAFQLGDGSEPLSSFVILEYIEGEKLSRAKLKTLSDEQRQRLYTSLADIYIQLRRLEFPSIGCLTQGPKGFDVRKKTATIDVNMQELEGLQPSKIQNTFYSDNGSLTSANKYVSMLLQIADNAFVNGRNNILDQDHGEDALYHLYIFREYTKGWMDYSLDQGPFVLVHGDLEPFNIIVNERMDIASVLDWEWSRIVPLQFNKPPLWLKYPDTVTLALDFVYQDYLESLNQLLEIVRTREREKYGNDLLSNEWAKAKENSGFLVANALENWTDMDWFANRYINWKWYKNTELKERVKAFMEDDPVRKTIIERKLHEGIAYRTETDRLNDAAIKSAPSYRDKPTSVYATIKDFFLQQLWKNTIGFSLTFPNIILGGAMIITGTSYLLVRQIIRSSLSN